MDHKFLADRFYKDTSGNGTIDNIEKTNNNVNFDKLATEVADVVNKHNDREWLQAFTDILGGYGEGYEQGNFVNQYYDGILNKTGSGKDTEYIDYTIKVPAGYYMILDRTKIDEEGTGVDESYSARMLFVANDIKQEIKEDVPTLNKQISRNDSYYGTEAAGVGDEVNFRLTGTLPSNYDNYTLGYQFKFTDTLSKGLTLKGSDGAYVVSVKVKGLYNSDGKLVTTDTEEHEISTSNVKMDVSHTHENSGVAYVVNYKDNVLTVTFPCLKEIEIPVNSENCYLGAQSEIYIDYTAVVNKDAIVSPTDGNKNKAVLTYSDNPQSYDDVDNTTEHQVTVYTFGLDITKVDAAAFLRNDEDLTKSALGGAQFVVLRKNPDINSPDYWQIAQFQWVEKTAEDTTIPPSFKNNGYNTIVVWDTIKGSNENDNKLFDSDGNVNTLYNTAYNNTSASTPYYNITSLEEETKGTLNISGLDDGVTYTIIETATPKPDGDYAKINPFTITLTAAKNADGKEYTGKLSGAESPQSAGTFSFESPVSITDKFEGEPKSDDDGSANMLVANFKYIDLPSTGGVGTVWFYILGGGVLALSGVLFFLSKKKPTK